MLAAMPAQIDWGATRSRLFGIAAAIVAITVLVTYFWHLGI